MITLTNTAVDNTDDTIDLRLRQKPLRDAYKAVPAKALVRDSAQTTSTNTGVNNTLRGQIVFDDPENTQITYSLHSGVGGDSRLPVPGDLFCAAIASCLDTSIKVIANLYQIQLKTLAVHVSGVVDLRGTLKMEKDVAVGFQEIAINIDIEALDETHARQLPTIVQVAEQSCVVLQTIKQQPHVVINTI